LKRSINANDTSYHQFLASDELGGAGLIGLHISDYLAKNKLSCRLWVPGDGPAEREARRLGLPVSQYKIGAVLSNWRPRAVWGNWLLGRALRRAGAGLVHVHGILCYGLLHWGLRLSGLKQVVHVHIETEHEVMRWALRSPPELIITCARFLVDQVRLALPPQWQDKQRIVALPNAVETQRFFPGNKEKAKELVGAPADQPLVLMLANLAPHKGQETAIRAISLLKERRINLTCWLAGVEREGEDAFTARLRSLVEELAVSDRVRLLGHRADAPDLMRAADYFLLPSTHEGLPLSVLEAQASKVPVLAAPTAGIPEVVSDGKTGFLIAADDSTGYADVLQTLLAQPELSRCVTKAAYAQVVDSYTWSAYCRRIKDLYQEVLDAD
jgi:glycosyltransferase involved in cell wall biosynthesis